MDSFLHKFFPSVYRQEIKDTSTNQYCKFDSQLLTAFTSSLYLAALIASFFASIVTRLFGRKKSMLSGGVVFLVGAVINGCAKDVTLLIVGRILLGIGVGFANQVIKSFCNFYSPTMSCVIIEIVYVTMDFTFFFVTDTPHK
jgi:MFS transporter, SP family, sugar:H+ symporter